MHISDDIQISLLHDFETGLDFLLSLGLTKRQIKLHFQNKNFLSSFQKKGKICELPINLINRNGVCPFYSGKAPIEIFSDSFLVAFSKPCKIHSLPLKYNESNNLVSYLRSEGKKYREVLKINQSTYERGLLHRLDFETSGLILFAKDSHLYSEFRKKIQKKKYYLAVVHGGIEDAFSYAHYVSYLGEKKSIGRASISSTPNAHIKGKKILFDKRENLSLVLVLLNEGMRHQVRLQLAEKGHPIVGDKLYGKSFKNIDKNRMFLHSFSYQFTFMDKLYSIIDKNFDGLEVIFDRDRSLKMAEDTLLRLQSSHF